MTILFFVCNTFVTPRSTVFIYPHQKTSPDLPHTNTKIAGGRSRVDNALFLYRQKILYKHRSGHFHKDIIEYLERRHYIRISRSTFARILHEWTED